MNTVYSEQVITCIGNHNLFPYQLRKQSIQLVSKYLIIL